MTVYLVGAGPGDPGLLTRRGAELIARADVLVYDRLVDPALFELAPPGVELIDVGKRPGGRGGEGTTGADRQDEINELLVDRGRAGGVVVRLKGGDPFLFGRGGEEAEALGRAGVPYEVVPGLASAFAVPAVAGVPVTYRGVATSVTVVTGRVGGQPASTEPDWRLLARTGGTLVVMMGVATRGEIAAELMAGGRAPSTPVTAIESGTTPAERVVRTTLEELGATSLRTPAVLVIGDVAGLELTGGQRPLAGRTVVVTRPRAQAGELTAALREAGARVLEVPTIEIAGPPDGGRALEAAVAGLDGYEWIAFTSVNAVERLLERVADARLLAGVGLAAVGGATAGALTRWHLRADLVAPPDRSHAQGLADAFPFPSGRGTGRVLHPRAESGREALGEGLRAKGWLVDEVVAYRTRAAPAPSDATAELLGQADAVTFTSPSTATSYLALRTSDGRRLPVPPVVACVGPVTASAARKAGLEVTVEAASPSPAALVEALVSHFGS